MRAASNRKLGCFLALRVYIYYLFLKLGIFSSPHKQETKVRHMKKNVIFPFVICAAAALGSCVATKAYSGPKLSDEELSRIYFHSINPLDLSGRTVDGLQQKFFELGFDVLAGEHSYSLNYNFENRDCFDPPCTVVARSGSCSGNFKSEAGKEYTIDVISGSETASATVYTDANRTIVGKGSCN